MQGAHHDIAAVGLRLFSSKPMRTTARGQHSLAAHAVETAPRASAVTHEGRHGDGGRRHGEDGGAETSERRHRAARAAPGPPRALHTPTLTRAQTGCSRRSMCSNDCFGAARLTLCSPDAPSVHSPRSAAPTYSAPSASLAFVFDASSLAARGRPLHHWYACRAPRLLLQGAAVEPLWLLRDPGSRPIRPLRARRQMARAEAPRVCLNQPF